MATSTIKLFLPHGDAKRMRTAEISNWSGKAVAAPRTELSELLGREELKGPGIYILFGSDPETGDGMAYIGQAEVVKDRLRGHVDKEFWVQVVVFVGRDENLTKSHVLYLEGRLISEAKEAVSLLLIPSAGNNGASFAAHRLKNTPGHAASP